MWMVPPEKMCDKHLLGEHVELHMFAGSIAKGISMHGFVTKGLLELRSLEDRHEDLAREMAVRGMRHKSLFEVPSQAKGLPFSYWAAFINREWSAAELRARCSACAARGC